MLPEMPDKEKSSDESLPATDLSMMVRGHEGISPPPIAHAKKIPSPHLLLGTVLPVCYSATGHSSFGRVRPAHALGSCVTA